MKQISHKSRTGTVNVQSYQTTVNHWVAPAAGGFKVNVDASVYEGTSSFTVGMILRDHLGGFCKAGNSRQEGEVIIFEAEEAWGVSEIDY